MEDGTAGRGGTGKGNLVNVHVGGEECTGGVAIAGKDVHYTWWESVLHISIGLKRER